MHTQRTMEQLVVRGNCLAAWPLDGGDPRTLPLELEGPVSKAEWLPDGNVLVACLGPAPRVLSFPDGVLRATLGHDEAYAVTVHNTLDLIAVYDGPSDERLESAHLPTRNNDKLSLWTASGTHLAEHEIRLGHCLIFHPTDEILIFGRYRTSTLIAWDLEQRKTILEVDVGGWVTCVAMDPSGSQLAVGTSDKKVRLLSFPKGELQQELTRCGVPTAVWLGVDRLIVGSKDGQLRQAELGGKLKLVKAGLVPHLDEIRSIDHEGGATVVVDRSSALSIFEGATQSIVGLNSGEGNWVLLRGDRDATFSFRSSKEFARVAWGHHENHIGPTAMLCVDEADHNRAHLTFTKKYSPRGEPKDTAELALSRQS